MSSRKKISLIIGLVIIAMFVIMAFFPSLFTSYGRKEMFDAWMKPCSEHILGTNSLGYDIFTELVYAAKDTLLIGSLSALLSMLIALIVAALANLDNFIGKVFSGLIRIFASLPKLVCLIVLSAFVGNRPFALIAVIALFSWSASAKLLESQIAVLKEKPFIESLRMHGFSKLHITLHHIIPNLFDVIITRMVLGLNACIMMESTLSFLGIGNTYYPTWGTMVNFAYTKGAMLRGAYAYLVAPGICIMLLSLAFYFISSYIEMKKEEI